MNMSIAAAPEVTDAETPVLGLRLRAAAHEQLLRAEAQLAGEGEARHTGIHQARKSIRRVRAMLALGIGKLDLRADRLDQDLAQLCRGLSRLRDAQALIEALQRLHDGAPDDVRAILPAAVAAARQRRDRLLAQALTRDPDLLSRRRRLRTMVERLLRLDWQSLGNAGVTAAILHGEHRVGKAGRRAKRHPDRDHGWHVFRRRLRRLRQQDTVLSALRPELRPRTQGLEDQAGMLGEAQDDALLLLHCGRASPFLRAQRALLRRIARERLQQVRRG